MRVFKPKSFLSLILLGYCLALLPLALTLLNAARSVDMLAEHGQETLYQAVQATQHSRILAQELPNLERAARQYLVLGDHDLFERYEHSRTQFYHTWSDINALPLNDRQANILGQMAATEQILFDAVRTDSENGADSEAAGEGFGVLSRLAQDLIHSGSLSIDHEAGALQHAATESRHSLLFQASTAVPVAIALAILFSMAISRPIRQIHGAINDLGQGQGDAGRPIKVSGPRDLERLGERLEWLRVRLRTLERERARFLRHVSHELKTPLTTIREGADLLAEGVAGPLQGTQAEVTQIMRDSSRRLQELIENLLSYNIAHRQGKIVRPTPLDLRRLVDSVVSDHQLALQGKDIKLNLDIDCDRLSTDAGKLRAIMDNLLSNAIKFTPESGAIRISSRNVGSDTVLEVSDSGPGIESGDLGRIFEPFYQGKAPRDCAVPGSGLGLSIVAEHARALDGCIEAGNNDDGGACMRVTLPMWRGSAIQALSDDMAHGIA